MLLASLLLAAAAETAAAPIVKPGEITDPIVCATNPKMSYALYLPKAFTTGKSWPILFVFDPRARGKLAAEVFREIAETRGYIIASSNNTESDNPKAPNGEAIDALWRDALSRLPVDPKRIYATGYSGGARLACTIGYSLKGTLAGVIAVGGGFAPDRPPVKGIPFVLFGTAGIRDFNYFEMRGLDGILEKLGVAHRIETFDGGHEWPPEALAAQALEWMDLQGVRSGRIPADPALVASYWERESAEARALEPTDTALAFVGWKNLAQDLAGLRDVAEATASAERLRAVAEPELKRREKIDKRDLGINEKNRRILDTVRSGESDLVLTRLVGDLGIAGLRKEAVGDSYEAQSAQRRLAEISPLAGSYIPKELMERGDYRGALTCYAIAAAVRPEAPGPQFNMARAQARLGSKRDALAALGRALDNGFDDRARFESDPDLASVRSDPAYATLLARLPKP
jgi:dienelactone hydrolase